MYNAQTRWTQSPVSVSLSAPPKYSSYIGWLIGCCLFLKIQNIPKLGHIWQGGFITFPWQGSQNHGSVEHEEAVLDTLPLSVTP